jgi:hypothetical protein
MSGNIVAVSSRREASDSCSTFTPVDSSKIETILYLAQSRDCAIFGGLEIRLLGL